MNTKAKSNSVITHNVSEDTFITFNVLGVGSLTLDTTNLSNECRNRAMIHGMIQRISDAAAISRDTETGQPATAQEKFDAMKRLVDHYESGTAEWSRVAAAGEGKSGGLLARALVKITGKPMAEVQEWMTAQDKADLSRLRHSPQVSEAIASFRSADTEEVAARLLDELK